MAKKETGLNIESMSTTGEIVKTLLNDDKKIASINILAETNGLSSAIVKVQTPDGSFEKKYTALRTTKSFMLKLIALLDQQANTTKEVDAEFANLNSSTVASCDDIRRHYEII